MDVIMAGISTLVVALISALVFGGSITFPQVMMLLLLYAIYYDKRGR